MTIEIAELSAGYGGAEVLHGVSLALREGEAFALVGKNGAGKSTLLKTIIGLRPRMGGKIAVLGSDLHGERAFQKARLEIGYAPQEYALFSDLTVNENLRLGLMKARAREYRAARDRVVELFPVLGERLGQTAGTLSGGEQKMLAVGRALIKRPRLLLLDEVSEGVQPLVADRLVAALSKEREERNVTLMIVEQNIDFVLALSESVGLFERGELCGRANTADRGAEEAIRRHLEI